MGVNVKTSFLAVISGFSLLVTFDTVWLLASFISYRPLSTRNDSACQDRFSESIATDSVLEPLLLDCLLLLLFILQHSLMARINIQWILDKIGLGVLTRCVYVLASCAALQGMMNYWQPVTSVCLWDAPRDSWIGTIFWSSLVAIHVMSWFIVYGGCLLVDVGELIGLKQVLYYARGLPDPMKSKSERLIRYYKHMRHPSFIGFSLLFWGVPQMSLDRAALAFQLTMYMFIAWSTDEEDISYLRYQLEDKETYANGDWHYSPYSKKLH
ncbi:nurim homolog [Ischnura elegans]|uniref:nurim homolog n=1 Tax=Ischnura elegans TaxID=197161 RepID=UPI001ED884C5|nr:nurim homolog [Ischnura elegans]